MIHKKLLSLLVLLLTAASGAWAADTYTITFSGFGNEACNKTVSDATLEYSETFNIADVYANYTILGGVRNSNEYVSISYQGNDITITVKSPFEGTVNVTVDYMNENWDECQRNISVTCVKSAPAIVVAWDASTKTGTFNQPGSDVVLTPLYAPTAMFATDGNEVLAPEAAEGVIAGTDAPLIAEGTGIVAFAGTSTEVTQGTVMYAVTDATVTEAPALTAFSATVPTAKDKTIDEDGADVLVWYYIQGADAPQGEAATLDNTFNNSDIASLKVSVRSNKFDLALKAANANTIEAGKATVTVGGTAATVTDGKLQGVKMGSEVKMTTKAGYKFRKVEVKKGGKPVATLTKAPMPWDECSADDALLMSKGTAEGGTLMYKVTKTNEKPTSTEGFSTDNPVGVANPDGNYYNYIWYYIKGDENHSDSEIFAPIVVFVAVS